MPWQFQHSQHIGARTEQQDRLTVVELSRPDTHLCVLADGMGGHAHGAEAAQTVIEVADAACHGAHVDDPLAFLTGVCESAHETIRRIDADQLRSPGTTCILLLLCDAEAYWVHVGDSRLYQFRGGQVVRRTEDHSLAALVARRRAGSPVPQLPANSVYKRLGGDACPAPDFDAVEVEANDIFALSSDGLWQHIPSAELAQLISADDMTAELVAALLTRAVRRAGSNADNASLLLARWLP